MTGEAGASLPPVLFVCVENSNRSQMAEAFARMHGRGVVEAFSAGSRPSGVVNPRAIEMMRERGYDLSTHASKSLEQIPPGPYAAVVTWGAGTPVPGSPRRCARTGSFAIPRRSLTRSSGQYATTSSVAWCRC
jgi:arsenate reductase